MITTRLAVVLSALLLAAAVFAIASTASQGPPSAYPVGTPAPRQGPDLTEGRALGGRGPEARSALELSKEQLPFHPLLPAQLPHGFELTLVESKFTDARNALLDVVYLGPKGAQLHIFESNYPLGKQAIAPTRTSEVVRVGDQDWEYRLLEFQQPRGPAYLVHVLTQSFDGALYISVALHTTGDLATEKKTLATIVQSLR